MNHKGYGLNFTEFVRVPVHLLTYLLTYLFMYLTGGDAAPMDEITEDGQNGVSFIHPMGEIFLQPLAGEITRRQVKEEQRPESGHLSLINIKRFN